MVETYSALMFGIVIVLALTPIQENRTRAEQVVTLAYLWLFRGTPVLFQVIFIYNVLPSFGIKLSAFLCALLSLSLNDGAYMTEILHSGLQAVKQGTRPAALPLPTTRRPILAPFLTPQ